MAQSIHYKSDEEAKRQEEAARKIQRRVTVKAVMRRIEYRDMYYATQRGW